MKFIVPLILSTVISQAAVYSIDVNDADNSLTAAGWTTLDAANAGDGGTVTLDGIQFGVVSSDGARLRGTVGSPDPDALYGDFAFDDGGGQALIMQFGGAGALAAGEWQVEVWVWDQNYTGLDDLNFTVGYRTNGSETEMATGVNSSNSGAAYTFNFTSDGTSTYDTYIRENNTGNRTRLNAVRLTQVPEPSSTALLGLGGLALLIRRKR